MNRLSRTFLFSLSAAFVYLLAGCGVLTAQGLIRDPVVRMDMENLFVVPGANNEQVAVHCLDSSQFTRHGSTGQSKDRILCEADWGQYAIFSRYDMTTGDSSTLLVDVKSGHWLRINDAPSFPPREPEESPDEFATRLGNPGSHTFRIESSSWRFDPFDGETAMAAKKRVWARLQESDPDLAILVANILETFGGTVSAEAVSMTHLLKTLIYDGKKLGSPGLNSRRLHSGMATAKDHYEISDFEEKFGK